MSTTGTLLRKASSLLLLAAMLLMPAPAPATAQPAQPAAAGVTVHPPVTPRISPNASSLPIRPPGTGRVYPEGAADTVAPGPPLSVPRGPDPVRQASLGTTSVTTESHGLLSSPIVNFDGMAGGNPADPNGDVGPNHYVQMINASFQIFNKTGTSLAGPFAINTLWSNAGDTTECATTNDGDPIVLYDHLADRWLLSQFDATGPNYGMCIAISRTPDPTGQYYLYRFVIPAGQSTYPDYEKFGVWPDGYYMSSNEGDLNAYVFERSMMLTGNPARVVEYGTVSSYSAPAGYRSTRLLPSELDGPAPPAGSANYFIRTGEDIQGTSDHIDIFQARVNWGDPLTSSFTLVQTLATAPFSFFACGDAGGGAYRLCIDQPNTTQLLDALMGRPMYRLQYRNFGSHETLVFNQTVNANGGTNTGIRWYENRRTTPGSGLWGINQQGTYAPQAIGANDTTWVQRWMGSAAMDKAGNIALAYNVVNDDDVNPIYPGIRYTGRVAADPVGILPQGEETNVNGISPSTQVRWGDYTSLSVDPVDGCTFWYTAEYIGASNQRRTRIASFVFPSCNATDLAITKTDSPDPVSPGDKLTYTINVVNNGPNAATNVVVTDTLPAGVTFGSSSPSCVEAPVGTLTCSLGGLASGANKSLTIQVTVLPSATGPLTNTATVSADQSDPNLANNSATASTQVNAQADLRVLKECKPDQPNKQPAGTETFCDVYVDNLGPSDAKDVVITDQLIGSTPFTVNTINSSSTVNPPATCLPATPIGATTSTTITCTDTLLPAGARD